jgi:hypothetical protein
MQGNGGDVEKLLGDCQILAEEEVALILVNAEDEVHE